MPDESKKGEYTVVGGASPTGRSWHFGGDREDFPKYTGGTGAAKTWDDPDTDGTDVARPAWWRGNDRGVDSALEVLEKALSGKDDGRGVIGYAPLEIMRQRLRVIVEQNKKSARSDDLFKNADFRTLEERISSPFPPPPPWPKDKTQRVFLSSAEPKSPIDMYVPTSETIKELDRQFCDGWAAKWKITRTVGETTTVEEFELTVPPENKD